MNNSITLNDPPITEIVFGITTSSQVFDKIKISKLVAHFSKEFPVYREYVALENELLVNDFIQTQLDPNITGSNRVHLTNEETGYLIQFQGNKLFFNWLKFGSNKYPGFTEVLKIFEEILKQVESITKVDLKHQPYFYELTYCDKIYWKKYISSLSEIRQILKFEFPKSPENSLFKTISMRNYFEIIEKQLIGYISVNNGIEKAIDKGQIKDSPFLYIENTLRGVNPENFDDWFKKAHIAQTQFFDSLFESSILK